MKKRIYSENRNMTLLLPEIVEVEVILVLRSLTGEEIVSLEQRKTEENLSVKCRLFVYK